MCKVSVILPIYNAEKTLRRCLDSVLSQTLSDIEIIAVNDGSTDGTKLLLSSYTDNRLKVINQDNFGQGYARNTGIAASHGKYIGFVDSDDEIAADMYEKMYEAAEKHCCSVVQCSMLDIKNQRNSVRPEITDRLVKIENRADYVYEYYYKLLHTNEVCNKLFLSSFLDANSISFCDTKEFYSEDLKFNIDVILAADSIYYIGKPLYFYNIMPKGHCLSSPVERIRKTMLLYSVAFSSVMDKAVLKGFCLSALVAVLTMCAHCPDGYGAFLSEILTSRQLQKYVKISMFYRSNFKHFILMLALLTLPCKIKMKIIKKHYFYD